MFKELNKTYSLNILDVNFIPDVREFHNLYKIINVNTGKDDKLHDIFELHYIELRKFTKQYHELVTAANFNVARPVVLMEHCRGKDTIIVMAS